MKRLHYVGLDVHARTISVAVAEGDAIKSVGTIEHDVPRLRKLLREIGPVGSVHVFYEAGPTGYGLCRALRKVGYCCEVIAPSLVPTMAGDRIKTDRRDAEKLARLAQAGLLTSVYVPELAQEAIRDLVRAREGAKEWQKKAGQQLDKFLLRHGRRFTEGPTKWTQKHLTWVHSQRFEQIAQQLAFEEYLAEYEHQVERVKRLDEQVVAAADRLPPPQREVIRSLTALKGIRSLAAITVVSEIGDMMRFGHPTQLMSYAGSIPSEHSTGESVRHGPITKSGNAHLRRIIGEAAWAYSRGNLLASASVRKRRKDLSPAIVAIAERADSRLRRRYKALAARGKHKNKVVTAVARELFGFIWAIGVQAQLQHARTSHNEATA